MKKVLLIGDSIRLGYRSFVGELLKDEAVIHGPDENCRFSAYTLWNLDNWAPARDYDVIQWNNGQWDTCHMADGQIHTPLPRYIELQERIANILQSRTTCLIFATTTPVWPEQFTAASCHQRRNEDIISYNMAAKKLCVNMGIQINDLHAAIAVDVKRYINEDMVHLTEEGNRVCAEKVAELIRD
jgi:hypothetical protein